MKRGILIIITVLLCNSGIYSQKPGQEFYSGLKLPGKTPELFAPEVICTGLNERDIAISIVKKEIYYGFLTGKCITIMCSKSNGGKWSEPEVAQFAEDDKYYYLEPSFTSDGNRIFFLSTRPPSGKEPRPGWTYQNIWAADRKPDGSWNEPYILDTTINSGTSLQYFPSVTRDGTMYFTRVDISTRKPSIYRSRLINGKFASSEKLPSVINMEGTSPYNCCIAPDESYLIVCIEGRKNDINPGRANYYIFFRDNSDKWSEGISFGPEINMMGSVAISSSVSPDGKYIFFAAQKVSRENEEINKSKKLGKMLKFLFSPQNGNYDIYWVDSKIIGTYRKELK